MMLRAFIAIEIPAGIQGAIAHSTASLKNALPKPLVRWVAPQNVHLTLKFLGDVSPRPSNTWPRHSKWKPLHTECSPCPWAGLEHSQPRAGHV